MGSFLNLFTVIVILNFKLVHQSVIPHDESDWEHILRELIFKTISPAGLSNNNLYKQLLRAPIYKRPNSTATSSPLFISKGNVIFLPPDKWILCEENCINCNECHGPNNPTIKWIMKRTKVSDTRYDLQITVTPQVNASFNLGPQSFVYIITESKEKPAESSKYEHFEEKNVLPSSSSEDLCDDPNFFHSQLIMGTDDFGKKYLIQIIKSDIVQDRTIDDGFTKFLTREGDEISYANLLRCIVKSLNSRKKSIDQFLAPAPKAAKNLGSKRNLYIKWEDITFTNEKPEESGRSAGDDELKREVDFQVGAEGNKFESMRRVALNEGVPKIKRRDGGFKSNGRRRNRWGVNPKGSNSTQFQKQGRV